jgi:hypothetical protein
MSNCRWVLLLAAAALAGCGVLAPRKSPVVLATDRPEMAAVVEYFNALPSGHRVVLSYRPQPVEVLLERKPSADLVLGPFLSGAASRRALEPLDDLLRRGQIRREDFYPALLAGGREDKRQILLPFAFNVPAVVFAPGEPLSDIANLAVDLEYLRQKSGQFNQSVRSRLVRVGYSPLWVPEFLFTASTLFGVGFQEGAEDSLRWNSQGLQALQGSLSSWVGDLNQGLEQDDAFTRRYLYEPLPRLLDTRRILFYPTASGELLDRLAEQDEEADFRWLRAAAGIPVADDVQYFGLPRGSRNRRTARLFLVWLFQADTQARLLEIKADKRLPGFGLVGGFSALRTVSERYYPERYRQLLGRLPPEGLLLAAPTLPSRWAQLKAEVVVPWLSQLVRGQAEEKDLTSRLRDFREQRASR